MLSPGKNPFDHVEKIAELAMATAAAAAAATAAAAAAAGKKGDLQVLFRQIPKQNKNWGKSCFAEKRPALSPCWISPGETTK